MSSLRKFLIVYLETPLPSREFILGSAESKTKLIEMVFDYILLTFGCAKGKLFEHNMEGSKESSRGAIQECKDVMSEHEEADVIIPFQVNYATKNGCDHA